MRFFVLYDDKLRIESECGVQYFVKDHLGSTNALADSAGVISSSTTYDSYGNATADIATRYRYTGRELDTDIGLYYYRNRWYDSEIGKFISEDPIGFAGDDANLYGYVWNSPIKYSDPTGLDGWGNDTADWLDERIEYARRWYQGGDQNWVWNGSVNSVADFSRIGADVFRLGSGAGCALYNDQVSGYDKAWAVAADIARTTAITGGVGGSLKKVVQVAKKFRKSKATKGLVDPTTIRFTQNSIGSKFSDGRSVKALIDGLKSKKISPNDIPPIRTFVKDGLTFSLDNRRLFAASQAGVGVKTVSATSRELFREFGRKFTTPNQGCIICIRGPLK